jgi:hypothetical protein
VARKRFIKETSGSVNTELSDYARQRSKFFALLIDFREQQHQTPEKQPNPDGNDV